MTFVDSDGVPLLMQGVATVPGVQMYGITLFDGRNIYIDYDSIEFPCCLSRYDYLSETLPQLEEHILEYYYGDT